MGERLDQKPLITTISDDQLWMITDTDGTMNRATGETVKNFIQPQFGALSTNTWDLTTGTKKTKTLTANTAITLQNSVSGKTVALLHVTQDGTGGRTLSINGTSITINDGAGETTLVGIIDIGGGILAFDTNAAGGGGGGGSLLTDIVFTITTGSVTNTSGIWTPVGSNNWDYAGLSAQTLPGDFRIFLHYLDTDSKFGALGVSTTNAGPDSPYYDLQCGIVIYNAGDLKKLNNDAGTSVDTLSVGEYAGLQRVGSTIKVQKSTNGTDWTDVSTMALSSSATLYIQAAWFQGGKMVHPKGEGIV